MPDLLCSREGIPSAGSSLLKKMGQKQGAGARPLFRRYPLAWRRAQRPHPPASSPGSRARPGAGTDAVGVMHAQGLFQTIHVHPVVLVSRSRAHAIARRRHPEGCAKGRVHRALHFPPALRHPAIAKLNSTDAHELPQAGIVAVPPQVGGEAADADPARLPPAAPPECIAPPGRLGAANLVNPRLRRHVLTQGLGVSGSNSEKTIVAVSSTPTAARVRGGSGGRGRGECCSEDKIP